MDIGLLTTFLEVRKARNFGRAAENLFITQAAVSARVKQLEEHLGVKLFLRQRNNLQLTPEGERLVPHAKTVLLAWSKARQDVDMKPEKTPHLTIGSTAGLWFYGYQQRLALIMSQMPEMYFRTEVYPVEELVEMVLERAVDVAILCDAPSMPDLIMKPLEKLQLVLASNIPNVTLKSALQMNYIYVDWGAAFNIFHAKRLPEFAPAMHYTAMGSIAEAMMKEIKASAFLPKALVECSEVQGLKVVDGAPLFKRDVSVVYRSNSDNKENIESLIFWLSKLKR
jgi:DNA-binding transcriptional LysR family regulator